MENDQRLRWFREQFRPHFDHWVTGTIGKYISVPEALVSFILIACAIDWLAGFWWGESTEAKQLIGETEEQYKKRREGGGQKAAYIGFIDRYFPRDSSNQPLYDAEALYDSLRNGLVHMFTIKEKKYALTHNNSWLHLKKDTQSNLTMLNSEDFFADWLSAKNKYFDEVSENEELLNKFWTRFNRNGFLGLGQIDLSKLK